MVNLKSVKLHRMSGFSLFEACVVMLVVSIFLAVSASVIPHKSKPKTEADGHGRFECYYKSGKLYQQVFQGISASEEQEVTKCRFNPPIYAKYVVVNAVGGGGGGSSSNGGEPGTFYSSFHSATRAALVTTPGKGGNAGVDGTATNVYYENEESSTDTPLVSAAGGKSNREWSQLTVDDIEQCAITAGDSTDDTDIACGSIPRCQIIGDKIRVDYCFTSTLFKHKYLDLQSDIVQRNTAAFLKPPVYNRTNKTITYYDQGLIDEYGIDLTAYLGPGQTEEFKAMIRESLDAYYPSLFKMILTFNLHSSTTATNSLMTNYLNGMGITTGIGAANHGQGGARSGAGTNGAVIITW